MEDRDDEPREKTLRRYETILESLDDGVYAIRDDGTIVCVNERYAEMKGVDREDLLGTDIYEWVSDETAERALAERARMREEGLPPGHRPSRNQRHPCGATYRHMAANNLSATSDHPQFANKVTVSFPAEADNRMTAFLGQAGALNSYEVQASPTINRQDIVHKQVSYRNLRLNHSDAKTFPRGRHDIHVKLIDE